MKIFDNLGRIAVESDSDRIDVSELKSAIYFAKITLSNGSVHYKKIIKK